ncbi:MAG: DUF1736 domain-containing protein [Bacteroidetes bacterium]|nr:DUF1736 domain-containing protein [Bacteroidota bacterium]
MDRFNVSFLSKKNQLLLLVLITIGLNFNTLFNSYALDDGVVMTENSCVEKGFKGIPEILTKDLFYGFDKTSGDLSEARYRPFTLIIFAVEHQFFGENPLVSHLINVLLFTLLIVLLYELLNDHIFKNKNNYISFISCLLFAFHPIHTEVIANVKSRDEIIAFIFIISLLLMFFKYVNMPKKKYLVIGSLFFFIALLTRESALTFIAVVPLCLFYFSNSSVKRSLLLSIPLLIVSMGYLYIRHVIINDAQATGTIVSTNILNAPFLYATPSEAFATKVFILLKYIGLLIFPHPLSFDYGFNQIPYIDIFSFRFILSALTLILLILPAIKLIGQKSIYSFCILYFFITISIVSNFVVDVGTPLSERFLFQPSLAFCIVLAALYTQFISRSKFLVQGTLLIILIAFSIKTIARNSVWKNNETLALTDVNSATNSERVNHYAMELYILKANAENVPQLKNELFRKAVFHGERTLSIYPVNPVVIMELGTAYYGLGDYFKTANLWIKNKKLIPDDPKATYWLTFLSDMLYKQGNGFLEQGNAEGANKCFKSAVGLNEKNVEALYNLGGSYLIIKDTIQASKIWEQVKIMSPDHPFKKEDFIKGK